MFRFTQSGERNVASPAGAREASRRLSGLWRLGRQCPDPFTGKENGSLEKVYVSDIHWEGKWFIHRVFGPE